MNLADHRVYRKECPMANENCLEGMQCPNPKCLSYEPFRISVTTTVLMYDEGTEDDQMGGDQEWDETSYCECGECSHYGTVADFRITEETKHA
jgi:hypothetical protein